MEGNHRQHAGIKRQRLEITGRTLQIGIRNEFQQPFYRVVIERTFNRIYDDPDIALDLYTRQCSMG